MKTTRMKKYRYLILITLMAAMIAPFSACNRENVDPAAKQAQFRATDAPIDNAEVEAVFVTVSEIYVDGEKLEGFNKTTLELSALTEGKSAFLGEIETSASSVNNVRLVLDYEKDENGMSPGSYVRLAAGTKDKISSDASSIVLNANQQLNASGNTEIVFDFDLRKLIKEESQSNFEFVSSTEMQAYIRSVRTDVSSKIHGQLESSSSDTDKMIVYLYKKGTFDLEAESKGSGSSNVQFAGAINSAEVKENGEFTLAFINEGNYEIQLIEYTDSDNDGRLEVSGHAQLTSMNGVDLNGIQVKSESDMELDLKVTSWLPI